MHVLLMGSYKPLVKALKRGLEEEGLVVDLACNGQEGDSKVPTKDYDVIILDVMRPRDASLSLLQDWRCAGLKTHVLALTPSGSVNERIPGLKSMADDWLTKPFELEELLARLRALVCSNGPIKDSIRCISEPGQSQSRLNGRCAAREEKVSGTAVR
jgi:DNA-binding response OmpR family regulator